MFVYGSARLYGAAGIALLCTLLHMSAPPAAHAAGELNGSRVLIVYRDKGTDGDKNGVADSEQVARYYAQKRGVPASNLLPITLSIPSYYYYYSAGEYSKFYTDIVAPIKSRLATLGPDNIDVILLAGDVPTVMFSGTSSISVDNVLMGLGALTPTTTAPRPGANPYFHANPSFGSMLGHFNHAQYRYNGASMYLIGRLGSETPLRGIDQIDGALYAERFLYPGNGFYNGFAYVDSQYGVPSTTTKYTEAYLASHRDVQTGEYGTTAGADMNTAYASRFFREKGFAVKWENTTGGAEIGEAGATFSDGTSGASAPRALFYGGWYNFNKYNNVFEWLPGSVSCDVNSANMFGRSSLRNGATAAMYVLGEPYLTGHQRPHVAYYYLLNGYSFAEAAALATPLVSWMPLNEGDPLYTPMRPKSPVADVRPPAITAGFPKIVWDSKAGTTTLSLVIDDSAEPELATVRVEYGTTVAYGSTLMSSLGFSRSHTIALPWTAGQRYEYRLVLTDPAGNVTTTENLTYSPQSAVTIAVAAAASPSIVTGKTSTITVLGASPAGETGLVYTWSATGPGTVAFSVNGTNAAKSAVAAFSCAGTYSLQVVAKDATGSAAASVVSVVVRQTAAQVSVIPATASVPLSGTQQFSASVVDQFGSAVASPILQWSVAGGGSVSSAGVFTAGAAGGGPFALTAKADAVSGAAAVTVSAGASAPSSATGILFELKGTASELASMTNGAIVTPAAGPAGTLALKAGGAVTFVQTPAGPGVYFTECCSNVKNAYYYFDSVAASRLFDPAAGEIAFTMTSRRSWADRQAVGSYRVIFSVQNGTTPLFAFLVSSMSGRMVFTYRAGSAVSDFYYVPAGKEEQIFGNGVTATIRIRWDGVKRYLYVNEQLVMTTAYTKALPTWPGSSNFTIGAQINSVYGGYNSSDDIVSAFTVRR